MSTVYSVRVPKRLKEALERLEVDWQEAVRQFLERRVREEYLSQLLEEGRRLRGGMKRSIRAAKLIREEREHAH